ncbi:MAG: PIN domain-containing protein [Bacteroidota bacterium]|jgi:predicted nucleic acid-binding protein
MSRDYLLDTSIISWFGRLKSGMKCPECKALAQNLEDRKSAKIFLCPIPIGESQRGILLAPKGKVIADINSIIDSFSGVISIDGQTAKECYAELYARLFKNYLLTNRKADPAGKLRVKDQIDTIATSEMGAQENDLWLAAVAMRYNLILVTNDGMRRIKAICRDEIIFEDWLIP